MKKFVSALVALLLCLTTLAMAEEAVSSITIPDVTEPEVIESVVTDSTGAVLDEGIVVKIVDEQDNEEARQFIQKMKEKMADLANLKKTNPDTYIADFFAADELVQAVAEAFGADAKVVVSEFAALEVSGFDAEKHKDVVVTVKLSFATEFTQEKVIVMLGVIEADDSITWMPIVCDVADGAVLLTLDAETLKLIDNGKVVVSVLTEAK